MCRLRFVGSLFLFAGLVCAVVATAIDYWYYLHVAGGGKGAGVSHYMGLWRRCHKLDGDLASCYTWGTIKKKYEPNIDVVWLHVCQAFMIIGAVLNFATLIGALYTALKGVSVKLPRVAAILCASCYLTVVIVFASKYKKGMFEDDGTGGHFHAGFGLAIGAIIVDLTGAALVGVGHPDTGYRGL